jgi:hypothetical protein
MTKLNKWTQDRFDTPARRVESPETHYPNGAVRPEYAAPVPNNVKATVSLREYVGAVAVARNIVRDALELLYDRAPWEEIGPAITALESRLSAHQDGTDAVWRRSSATARAQGGE